MFDEIRHVEAQLIKKETTTHETNLRHVEAQLIKKETTTHETNLVLNLTQRVGL